MGSVHVPMLARSLVPVRRHVRLRCVGAVAAGRGGREGGGRRVAVGKWGNPATRAPDRSRGAWCVSKTNKEQGLTVSGRNAQILECCSEGAPLCRVDRRGPDSLGDLSRGVAPPRNLGTPALARPKPTPARSSCFRARLVAGFPFLFVGRLRVGHLRVGHSPVTSAGGLPPGCGHTVS